ncbi:EAL domain-containing response regulator [Simiduia sp. 21SJ11W-1]|uniref:EAL domain-containing response regulator n=1 Tax=Simiduia sp. 21SJ11W-1 TaxID=2909669 RepID=UPI0020A1D438|nr:EAL domain-containing response regulator [Simiduia sp. 21SJ11W-1]UTA47534.1 EAL domain-containing response regulator [Simiduia sp. 21SJ11W-1]
MTSDAFATLNCLIVDDDAFMLKTLGHVLRQMGVNQVFEATDAAEALRMIANRNNGIDLVISDLNMPGMDGIQLLRHLGALGLHLGVILISGEDPRLLSSVHTLGQQYELRILGTLTKPLDRAQLEALLIGYRADTRQAPRGPATMVFTDELQSAIIGEELEVWYQPKVEVESRRLLGVEALARWQHPEKGFISPAIFVGIAEKHGMVEPLTDLVLKQSLAQLSLWQSKGFNLTLAVNFSAQALCRLDLPERLEATVRNAGLTPEKIIVEMTESALPKNASATLDIMARLRLKGFGLSIDDFGTGFSTLEQLQLIPFTELKIDRAFVHGAKHNKVSQAILESSISLAKKLGIHCVAEGVEAPEDWALVEALGCDSVQGYIMAKPMPAEAFIDWAKTYRIAESER